MVFSFFSHLPLEAKKPEVKSTYHASRSEVRAPARPGGVAACIRHYESHNNYRAENNVSSASGAYQFLDSTWHSVTGLPGRAKDYSPAVQDLAFFKLWAGGKGASQWTTAPLCGY